MQLFSALLKKLHRSDAQKSPRPKRRTRGFRPSLLELEPGLTPTGPAHIYHVTDGTSLAAAVKLADGQTGSSEIILDNPGAYTISEPLRITADITITAKQDNQPSRYVIDPQSSTQGCIFEVTGAHDVVLADMAIEGGSTAGDGGGVDVQTSGARMTLADVIIQNNTAGHDGGGVYVSDGAALTIVDSIMQNNTAAHDGGGVYFNASSQDANVRVVDTTFQGNKAESGDGGGMLVQSTPPSGSSSSDRPPKVDLTVTGVSFLQNTSGHDGGGLWASDVTTFTADHVIAVSNRSVQDAGGVGDSVMHLNGASFSVTHSYFAANQVTGPGTGVVPDAGGVCFDFQTGSGTPAPTGTVTARVNDSQFVDNAVAGAGGGMFVRDEAGQTTFTATFTRDSFTRNHAMLSNIDNPSESGDGGGLYIGPSAGTNTVTLHRDTFANNSAARDGGGLFMEASGGPATVNLNDSSFSGNRAGTSVQGDGGGMKTEAMPPPGSPSGTPPPPVTLNVSRVNFTDNSSTFDGGGLWASDVTTFTADHVTAVGNRSVQDAGGIGDSVMHLNSASFSVTHSYLAANQVTGPGKSVPPDAGGVCFDFQAGGGSTPTGKVTAVLNGNTVIDNSVAGAGGGAFIRDDASGTTFSATVLDNRFSGNHAYRSNIDTPDESGNGGGLYLRASGSMNTVALSHNQFTSNTAARNGGGLYFEMDTGTADVSSTVSRLDSL